MKTLVIAEAGVNHNGEIDKAMQLIDIAVDAGADIVKFQTFKAEDLVTDYAKKANYQQKNSSSKDNQLQMLKKLELTNQEFHELSKYCAKRDIEFLSTAFDKESLDFLVEIGIKRIKIPSGDINNFPMLKQAAIFDMPIILSTGMCDLKEIERSYNFFIDQGKLKEEITILHCTTEYPVPINNINLLAMKTIRDKLQADIGYSDHSCDIETPIIAVALGAKVIEKHFTLSKSLEGPDHMASLEPHELKQMIASIKKTEIILGSKEKLPTEIEKLNSLVVRRSIVAKKDIPIGKILEESDLDTKRPGDGISPMLWDEIIGSKAKKEYRKDDQIEL